MRTELKAKAREFSPVPGLTLKDMGDIQLEDNEQVTFRIAPGKGHDVTRMEWGFYLANSVNWNLKNQGFKTALVVSKSPTGPRLFLNLVEGGKLAQFQAYLSKNGMEVVSWLDEWFGGK
ncbi:MAG: hypothetical protein WC943_06755 [Elusimicrobiota bacterium]|jgi:hypothetical protein